MRLLKIMLKANGQRGVPQGGVISPLLSNLYLTEVDGMLERAKETTRFGKYTYIEFARFADDLVILIDAYPRAEVAKGLVRRGVRRLVIAGGETSGAVVQALGISGLRIGPQIDPGVPWTASLNDPPLALALKSGNFGTKDFFTRAFACLH